MTSSTPLQINMPFEKLRHLEKVRQSLDLLVSFIRPALPLVNSHLTEFYTTNYWENVLTPSLRKDLESKSTEEVKTHLKDLVNTNWRNYVCPSNTSNFESATSFQNLIVGVGKLQMSEMKLSVPLNSLFLNGQQFSLNSSEEDINLKFDTIMSAKKSHEVEVMSDFINRISESVLNTPNCSETDEKTKDCSYLVDVGSGKGYLSSYLTLLHQFRVLAVDSSSINSSGCERRSAKLEKAWAALVRRAVERKLYGKCSKRGKHWKSRTVSSNLVSNHNEPSQSGESGREDGDGKDDDVDNKLLKTLTQFVTPEFDLTDSIKDNFPSFISKSTPYFGLVGLHTCGNLGVDSLKLFITNENAKFICNVPCCYHLLEENRLFYPHRRFLGSKNTESCSNKGNSVDCILKPTFPISSQLDVDGSGRFCLGRNARMMSAYSLPRMVAAEKGLELHPSVFYRCLLQVLIKQKLGDEFSKMEDYQYSVGKIGDKCNNFVEYVQIGLKNLRLDSEIQPTDAEIEELYLNFGTGERDRLHKYYLLRSIFASLIESVIILDRLAFLLEQDCVREAHIVELFDPSVSPRSHAIVALKY